MTLEEKIQNKIIELQTKVDEIIKIRISKDDTVLSALFSVADLVRYKEQIKLLKSLLK